MKLTGRAATLGFPGKHNSGSGPLLRSQLTAYEAELEEMFGTIGVGPAIQQVRAKMYAAIAAAIRNSGRSASGND